MVKILLAIVSICVVSILVDVGGVVAMVGMGVKAGPIGAARSSFKRGISVFGLSMATFTVTFTGGAINFSNAAGLPVFAGPGDNDVPGSSLINTFRSKLAGLPDLNSTGGVH